MVNPLDPQHQSAQTAYESLILRSIEVVLLPQVAYEFWVVATRPAAQNGLGYLPGGALATLNNWRQTLSFIDDDSGLCTIWLDLVDRYSVSGKPAHDARLVAAMIKHGIDRLLTFNDADFKRYSEITAESPLMLQTP